MIRVGEEAFRGCSALETASLGEVTHTDECAEAIALARAFYDSLSAEQHELVSNYAVLTSAKARYAELSAEPLNAASVSLCAATVVYNGLQRTPVVTVKNAAGETLVKGSDYTVAVPEGRTAAGTYVYTITGTGNYAGTVAKQFTIKPQQIKAENVSLYAATVTYNGKQRTPRLTVLDPAGVELVGGRDYTVAEPEGRTQPDVYEYVITGAGNFAGTVTKPFTINAAQ